MSSKKEIRKRSATDRNQDFLNVCKWRNEGVTWQEIANRIGDKYNNEGFSIHAIYTDFYRRLAKNVKIDATLFVHRMLQEIAAAKVEAMHGWERSCRDEVVKKKKKQTGGKYGKGTSNEKTHKKQAGDPRFLAVYDKLLDKELKIYQMILDQLMKPEDSETIDAVTIIQLPNNNR